MAHPLPPLVNGMANTEPTTGTAAAKERETLYQLQAEICRVLGHPRRIEILDLLGEGEKSSAELLRALRVSKVNLSQHLAVMKHVGLVETRHQGRRAIHRLAFDQIKVACEVIREVLAVRLNRGTRLAKTLNANDADPASG